MKRTRLRRVSRRRRAGREWEAMASDVCLSLAHHVCQRCGGRATDAHHVIGRRLKALRYEQQNLVALCGACHRWWHDHPKAALDWFVEKFGSARLQLLRACRALVAGPRNCNTRDTAPEGESEPVPWRCQACGADVPDGHTSHGRAEHAPGCDGSCRSCPVEVECGPCGPITPEGEKGGAS